MKLIISSFEVLMSTSKLEINSAVALLHLEIFFSKVEISCNPRLALCDFEVH